MQVEGRTSRNIVARQSPIRPTVYRRTSHNRASRDGLEGSEYRATGPQADAIIAGTLDCTGSCAAKMAIDTHQA